VIDRILVEYLHEGQWTWARDYPMSQLEEAKEFGRRLWRDGVAGVRISVTERRVLEEHRRSSDAASR
jgi:hypothetical protein